MKASSLTLYITIKDVFVLNLSIHYLDLSVLLIESLIESVPY